ncbi:MAG: MoaD/ThiS family protein [Methanobacteriota archaeon]
MPGSSSVEVRLPRSLQLFWQAPGRMETRGGTLAEALASLDERQPGLTARVLDDQGRIREHVGVFVNRRDVRDRAPKDVALNPGDVVDIIGAVSGG